jgi:hypothetical protein
MLSYGSAIEMLDTYAGLFDSDLSSAAVALDVAVTRISGAETSSKSRGRL